MRKHYIDNLRNLAILLLFPFHTSMIYNGFESFYIHGGFTPGHLCFLLYLFIIALITLPVMLKLNNSKGGYGFMRSINSPVKLLGLFVIPFVSSGILDIGGKSLGQSAALALLGYLMCRHEEMLDMA